MIRGIAGLGERLQVFVSRCPPCNGMVDGNMLHESRRDLTQLLLGFGIRKLTVRVESGLGAWHRHHVRKDVHT